MSPLRPLAVTVATVALAALLPRQAFASGWEPSSEAVWGLIAPGVGFALFTYVGQAFFWLLGKAGFSDARPNFVFMGLHPEANVTFLRVLRFAAFGAIGIGLFAWLVGWAKGTL